MTLQQVEALRYRHIGAICMESAFFSIGEFSQATGLTVKTLRFYHEEGLLIPAYIDPHTGYRFYDRRQVEIARSIGFFRQMELSLADVKCLLAAIGDDEKHIVDVLRRHRDMLRVRMRQYRRALRQIDDFIEAESQEVGMKPEDDAIQEKTLEPMRIAAIRMKGHYSDCGRAFGTLGRQLNRRISGKPMLLHYDAEYKEEDAEFEACMPVRQGKEIVGIVQRELPRATCVCLLHKGPYDQLSRAYAKVIKYVKERGYSIAMPTREVYLKGPGMIFRGNPRNYLTEVQIPFCGREVSHETHFS